LCSARVIETGMRRIEKRMVPRTALARRTSRKPGPSLQVQVSNAGQGANVVAKTALDPGCVHSQDPKRTFSARLNP
jgi:hypothetical protein